MPGRPSARSARSSTTAVARKSSAATLKSRGSASTRTSAHAVEVPDEGPETSLRTQICYIFAEAQKTAVAQRKLVVNLRKIQEACCYEPANPKKKGREEDKFEETHFNDEVQRCVLRLLNVKKSEPVGERLMRFLGVFLKQATEKETDNAIYQAQGGEESILPDTPTSRLVADILSTVLGFFNAKDKTVRYRSTQMAAYLVNAVDHVDPDQFDLLRLALLKRLRDKEPSVRVQAVLALGRLTQNDEDEDEDDEDSDDDAAGSTLIKFLDIMQNDPSAEVRKAVLINLPFRTTTLRWMLERARDLDPAIRRAIYNKILTTLGDFRHMSGIEREKLLRWGLRDRDEGVRKAAANLFRVTWLETVASGYNPIPEEERKPGEWSPPVFDALHELVDRIYITSSGVEDGIAHEAMRELWDGRSDYREFITFDDDFWNDLDAEGAFIARSFNDYCRSSEDGRLQTMVEDKIPEVSRYAYHVQTHMNNLVVMVRELAVMEEDDPQWEKAQMRGVGLEFAVEQLLHIALTLDYSDEMGRRQMYQMMRGALALPELPEECTKLAVEVLRTCCATQAEFCGVILEAIAEVKDTLMDEDATEANENAEESFHSARSDVSDLSTIDVKPQSKKSKSLEEDEEEDEERLQKEAEKHEHEVLVFSKCLHISQCMLQNIDCDIVDGDQLSTHLDTLIAPACLSHEAIIRERGMICLGLCALLRKDLATKNMQLFFHCYHHKQSTENMRLISIQVLTDVAIIHPSLFAPPPRDPNITEDGTEAPPAVNPLVKPLVKVLLKAFSSDSREQSISACTAASKLLFHNILPPGPTAEILKAFTLAYFDPETASNPALRQALTYFLPVFCHSKLNHARLMSHIAVPVISKLLLMREDIDEEDEEMVGWPIICAHLSEWTDGRRVVGATELSLEGKMVTVPGAEEPHIYLAIEILERALSNSCSKDERKPLLTLLSKVYISSSPPAKGETVDEDTLRTLHALVTEAVENKIGTDATTRNSMAKLEIGLTKRLGEVEHVTQAQDVETSEVDATEAEAEAQTEVPEIQTPPDEDEEDEDTMLANIQAEGTRFPLEEDDDDDDGDTITAKAVVTESDIVESLLESEI